MLHGYTPRLHLAKSRACYVEVASGMGRVWGFVFSFVFSGILGRP